MFRWQTRGKQSKFIIDNLISRGRAWFVELSDLDCPFAFVKVSRLSSLLCLFLGRHLLCSFFPVGSNSSLMAPRPFLTFIYWSPLQPVPHYQIQYPSIAMSPAHTCSQRLSGCHCPYLLVRHSMPSISGYTYFRKIISYKFLCIYLKSNWPVTIPHSTSPEELPLCPRSCFSSKLFPLPSQIHILPVLEESVNILTTSLNYYWSLKLEVCFSLLEL